MKKITLLFLSFALLTVSLLATAKQEVVNVYTWSNMVPKSVIKQFEKETHIRVNYSEFDNNETLYAKLKANPKAGYDVIEPSSYYVSRMKREDMLQPLVKKEMPNFKYLSPDFIHRPFDPNNDYSIPYMWSTTGLVLDKRYHNPKDFQNWSDLWNPNLKNQLLILDDVREAFGIALLSLGYSFNDGNLDHIKQAYEKLKQLLPNVKLFAADAEQTIYVDGDVNLGMGWSQDIYASQKENKNLQFLYPKPAVPLAIDCLAIPKNAPHATNAMRFINFILRPDIAKQVSLSVSVPTANKGGMNLLPQEIRNNSTFNPSAEVLKRTEQENELVPNEDGKSMKQMNIYWQNLKAGR